jgi:hypothetical protein
MKWILSASSFLFVAFGAIPLAWADGAYIYFGESPKPTKAPNAVPLRVEFREDITEPRLVVSRYMLTRAKTLAAAVNSSRPTWARLSEKVQPISWAGLFLGLAVGGLCLANSRKGWAVCAVLLALVVPILDLRANPVAPPDVYRRNAPEAQVQQLLRLRPIAVVVEDDCSGLWFRLQLPREKKAELTGLLAKPGPGQH